MRINKTYFVVEWWAERLRQGRQLPDIEDHVQGVRPTTPDVKWKQKVSNELLWTAFREWLEKRYPALLGHFNKNSFCTVFYTVSNSSARLTRQGAGKRFYAAQFGKLSDHRAHFEETHAALENKNVVESTNSVRLSA